MYIHTFGAYFGITAAFFFQSGRAIEDNENRNCGGYTSSYVSMLGTIFLFMFWPSFNAALAPAILQQRVVVNTALAISTSCLCAAGISRIAHGKLDMEIILHATIAGGVIIGASSNVLLGPSAAIIIGGVGGIVSALGFAYLSKGLQSSVGMHDTCGVNNLHGIPGILGGIIGAITASMAGSVIAKREGFELIFDEITKGRSSESQGGYQMAALGVTLGLALMGGAFSGFCASRVGYEVQNLFDDEEHWHNCAYDVPLEEEEVIEKEGEPRAQAYFDPEQDQEQVYEHEEDYSDGKENIN